MKYLRASLLTACILSNCLVACGGDTFESGDDASGGNNGDGDGDTGGSTGVGGTGGTTGGGGTVAVGGCTALYAYGLSVTVRSGASVEDDARDAAPPATGGGTNNLILPPDLGTGGLAGTGGSMSTGGATGTDGCAAVVTATEGEYREVLECFVQAEDCQCFGAGERPGTYTVAGMLNGTMDTVTDVVVESDGCHVIGKTVTLFEWYR